MAFARRSLPLLAVVALASLVTTPRISNSQIMDPGCPPHGMVAVGPGTDTAGPESRLALDDFLSVRATQLRLAAMRWLTGAPRAAAKARTVRLSPRTQPAR